MQYLLYVLAIVAAILVVIREFIGKPDDSKKRWSWRLGCSVVIIGCIIAILTLPQKEGIEDSLNQIQCSIDSLKPIILEMAGKGKEAPELADSAKQQAECIQATMVLRTALDSGLVAIGLGNYSQAITHLNYAIMAAQDDSAKAEGYFYRAAASSFWGDNYSAAEEKDKAREQYEEALACCDSALVYKRDFPNSWSNRGVVLYELGRYKKALYSFDSALVYKRDSPEAWYNRGNALVRLGFSDEAIASYDSALAYKQDYPEAWNNRGNALVRFGLYDEAIASCDSALAYKRDYPEAWYNRGVALGTLCRHEEALASFDSFLAYKRDYPEAWYNRGAALVDLQRYKEALASFDSALKYDPNFTPAVELRNHILDKMKK
jgi:tetratricopeptide (TPR) repeat protein